MERRNAMATVAVVAMLAGGLALACTSFVGRDGSLEGLVRTFAQDGDVETFVASAESAVNQDLDRSHLFIQLYGGVERLVGRRMVEDAVDENTVAKLSTEALNFVNPEGTSDPAPTAGACAAAVDWLSGELEEADIPYLFVVAPQKIQEGKDLLPAGLHEGGNQTADAMLGAFDASGTDYLDLRPLFNATDDYASWFFTTDHHWKPEAAFYAWHELAAVLKDRYGFATDPEVLDPGNWDVSALEDFFLGSQGKRTGSLYAGVDDFSVYTPLFETDLSYQSDHGGFLREGPFQESVCFPERIAEKDWFEGNPYTYYSGGDYAMATMANRKNPEGPKVVLIRDSFSNVLAPFLALSCSELTTVDMRYFEGNLAETLKEMDPDLVLTLYTSSSIGSEALYGFGMPGEGE